MIRIVAGLSIAITAFWGLLWPGQGAESNALELVYDRRENPGAPATVEAMSAAIVADLNAAASPDGAPDTLLVAALPEGAYVVQRGDSLYSIALKHYGTTQADLAILNANADAIADPMRLQAGQILMLPDRY